MAPTDMPATAAGDVPESSYEPLACGCEYVSKYCDEHQVRHVHVGRYVVRFTDAGPEVAGDVLPELSATWAFHCRSQPHHNEFGEPGTQPPSSWAFTSDRTDGAT